MTEAKVPPPPERLSAYERMMRARKWFWSSWTDAAPVVYRRSTQGKDRARVLWVEFLLFVREVVRDFFWRVQGTARASSLAYTTLLSLIPLIVALSQMLRIYFSKAFPNLDDQIEMLVTLIVPYQAPQIAFHLSRFADIAGTVSTFGAIVFLVISFRLFMAVEASINQIWKVEAARGYRQKLRAFTMLLFWGPLLIGLSFTTNASLARNQFLNRIGQSEFVLHLIPFLVLLIAFTGLFWLVPATRVHIKAAAVGGLITAVLFELVRFGFGVYARYLFTGNLNVVYGTLGLLIMFLLALELLWVVVLLGVEISYVYQNMHGIIRASEQQLQANPRYDLYFALRALVEISRRFEAREDAPSSYRLAEEFGSTDPQMLTVLRRLEDAQLVKEIGGDWTGFAPGCDPDRISVEEVVRVIQGGGREIPPGEEARERQLVSTVFSKLDDCASAAVGGMSIGQLVRELYGQRQPSRAVDRVAEDGAVTV